MKFYVVLSLLVITGWLGEVNGCREANSEYDGYMEISLEAWRLLNGGGGQLLINEQPYFRPPDNLVTGQIIFAINKIMPQDTVSDSRAMYYRLLNLTSEQFECGLVEMKTMIDDLAALVLVNLTKQVTAFHNLSDWIRDTLPEAEQGFDKLASHLHALNSQLKLKEFAKAVSTPLDGLWYHIKLFQDITIHKSKESEERLKQRCSAEPNTLLDMARALRRAVSENCSPDNRQVYDRYMRALDEIKSRSGASLYYFEFDWGQLEIQIVDMIYGISTEDALSVIDGFEQEFLQKTSQEANLDKATVLGYLQKILDSMQEKEPVISGCLTDAVFNSCRMGSTCIRRFYDWIEFEIRRMVGRFNVPRQIRHPFSSIHNLNVKELSLPTCLSYSYSTLAEAAAYDPAIVIDLQYSRNFLHHILIERTRQTSDSF